MLATMTSPAAKLRKMAEGLPEKIDNLRRPMTQNSTPKRQREYASRCIDGDNLERCRLAMIALADAWDAGQVPAILEGVRTKDAIGRLVRHGTDSTGYYNIHSTHQYSDKSEAGRALQRILDSSMNGESKEEAAATTRKRELERMIDRVRFLDIPGFFPTPAPVIAEMMEKANLYNGMRVLEPSAGLGDLADAIKARDSEAAIVCCETNYSLCEILTAKGYDLVSGEFLERFSLFDPDPLFGGEVNDEMRKFDRVIMNPPFERGQDAAHVMHAYKLLKKGGRLVSIVSCGPFFRDNQQCREFRDWIVETGAEVVDLDPNAFKGAAAFRSTGVACKMVIADRLD